MNVNLSHIPANREIGYSEHIRTWILRPQTTLLPSAAAPSKKNKSPANGLQIVPHNKEDSSSEPSSSECGDASRDLLTADPSSVLLNLTSVTLRILHHLPLPSVRSLACVCTVFRNLCSKETNRRNSTVFVVHRVLPIQEARAFIGAALFDQWSDKPNDPQLLFIFKIDKMHPPNYIGEAKERLLNMLPDPDAPKEMKQQFTMPKHFLESTNLLGMSLFVIDGEGSGVKRDLTFAAFYVPKMPGLVVRKMMQNMNDHAMRIGHFIWLKHCMNDLSPEDRALCEPRGFFLSTNCQTLGVPQPQIFDFPFCGVKCEPAKGYDSSYVYGGKNVRCASIWLDRDIHRGNNDEIRREFKKVRPDKLVKDALDISAMFFTNGRMASLTGLPLTEKSCLQEEVQVFRTYFPTAKLIGCAISAGSAMFGNTSCSLWLTSEADRVVRCAGFNKHPHVPRKSVFFITVLAK